MTRFLQWVNGLWRDDIPSDRDVDIEREIASATVTDDATLRYMRDAEERSIQRRQERKLNRPMGDLGIVLDTLIPRSGHDAGK